MVNDSAQSDSDHADRTDRAHLAGHANRTDRTGQCGLAGHHHPILFFDGMCGLCNGFVDLLLKADTRNRFRFSALQGETAHRMLGPQDHAAGPYSFIYLENERIYEQSNAVLLALSRLGGAWRLLDLLYIFPRPLRDFAYRIVARNRYRWFGRHDVCRIPAPEERERFLP